MNTFLLIFNALPAILQSVQAVEAAIPMSQAGQQKMNLILGAAETAWEIGNTGQQLSKSNAIAGHPDHRKPCRRQSERSRSFQTHRTCIIEVMSVVADRETSPQNVVELESQYLLQNYARHPLVLVRGDGPYMWDADGKRYLDFIAGIGVNALGQNHPRIVRVIQEQCARG